MAKAYSYIRFSRPEQMRGDSLRRQREAADKWAAANGLVIDESLTDLGVSAYRGLNRVQGALGRFHDLVARGEVPKGSYLIVESLDRLSRQAVRAVLPDFMRLINDGIIVATLMDGQVYSAERLDEEPMALFGSIMIMMRAHEESKTKGVRVSEAWDTKRAAASEKVLTTRVPGWLQVAVLDGKRSIEFKENGDTIVRRIFSETIQGYGRRAIAVRLKNAGHPPFEGGDIWQPSYIKKVLENRATLGELQCFKTDGEGRRVPAGEPVKGYYPAVVSEADFIRANAAKGRRTAFAGRRGHAGVVNLLRGLAFCGCGSRMMRENKGPKPKGFAYLICTTAINGGSCDNRRRWRVDRAERRVLEGTSRIDVTRLLSTTSENEQRGPTPRELEDRIDAIRRRLEGAMEMVEARIRGALERAKALNEELAEAEAELAGVRNRSLRAAVELSPTQRRIYIRDLFDRMEAATNEERADLRTRLAQEMRTTFSRVVFRPHSIDVTYKGSVLFAKVARPADVTVTVFNDDERYVAEEEASANDPEVAESNQRALEFFARKAARAKRPLADK